MAAIEISGSAEPKINRYEHQSRAVSDRHDEGPEPKLCRSYPRQRPRMTPVEQSEDTEPDHQKAGTDLDLLLPFDEGDQQSEGKNHQEHRQQMTDR